MGITYNPYNWEIRPRKTELQDTIEKEREIEQLRKKVTFMMNDVNTRINQFLLDKNNPVTLLIGLDKIFLEIIETIGKIASLNFELYGCKAYPTHLRPKHLYTASNK